MYIQEILQSDNIVSTVNENMDHLIEIIPEIKYMINFDHKHSKNIWNSTLLALSLSKNDFDIRLCLLLHDIGKPFSYEKDNIRGFKNHTKVSSEMAKKILKRLRLNEDYIYYICYLIENYDSPINDVQIENNNSLCLKLLEIQKCHALAYYPDKLDKRRIYLNNTKAKILVNKKEMHTKFSWIPKKDK